MKARFTEGNIMAKENGYEVDGVVTTEYEGTFENGERKGQGTYRIQDRTMRESGWPIPQLETEYALLVRESIKVAFH